METITYDPNQEKREYHVFKEGEEDAVVQVLREKFHEERHSRKHVLAIIQRDVDDSIKDRTILHLIRKHNLQQKNFSRPSDLAVLRPQFSSQLPKSAVVDAGPFPNELDESIAAPQLIDSQACPHEQSHGHRESGSLIKAAPITPSTHRHKGRRTFEDEIVLERNVASDAEPGSESLQAEVPNSRKSARGLAQTDEALPHSSINDYLVKDVQPISTLDLSSEKIEKRNSRSITSVVAETLRHQSASLLRNLRSPKPLVLRMQGRTELSAVTTFDRANALLNIIFEHSGNNVQLTGATVSELEAVQRLMIVLLCGDWQLQAKRCFESVVLRLIYHRTGFLYDPLSQMNLAHYLTKMLIWVIPVIHNKGSIEGFVQFWCVLYREQTRTRKEAPFIEVFDMGRLALTAKIHGHLEFAEMALRLWHEQMEVQEGCNTQNERFQVLRHLRNDVDDSGHTQFSRLFESPKRLMTNTYAIAHGLTELLTWMVSRFEASFDLQKHGYDSSLWHQAYLGQNGWLVDRQLMVAYLSFRGSEMLFDWPLPFHEDLGQELPRRIFHEWLSGETPMLTFAALGHMFQHGLMGYNHPTPVGIGGWSERMVRGVRLLLADTETALKFIHLVRGESFQTFSLNYFESLTRDSTLGGDSTVPADLRGIFRVVCGTTLFGSALPSTEQQSSVTSSVLADLPLLETPRSSMSDLRSFRSLRERTRNSTKRASTISWSSFSLYQSSRGGFSVSDLSRSLIRSSLISGVSSSRHRNHEDIDDKMSVDLDVSNEMEIDL